MPPRIDTRVSSPRRRAWRRTAAAAGVGFFGIVLATVFALLLRPLRERLLPIAVARLDAALPGTLQVERARWPAVGRIVLTGVRWSESDATLAAADELDVAVALRPLWQHDVVVRRLSLRGLRLDVPALRQRFAAAATADRARSRHQETRTGTAADAAGYRLARPGALPGLPSMAIDTLHVDAPVLRLPGKSGLGALRLDASFDVRHGQVPRLRLQNAQAQGPPQGWRVDSLAMDVDLVGGVASGSGVGCITPSWPVRLALTTDAPDRLVLRLSEHDVDLPPAAMGVLAHASIARRGLAVDSLVFTTSLRTPGTNELARVPAFAAWLRARPAAAGIQCQADGVLAFGPRPTLRLRATFVPGDLVRSGTIVLHRDAGGWEVGCDTLGVADVQLRGGVRGSVDSLTATLWLDVNGPRWQEWLGPGRGPLWTARAYFDLRRRRKTATTAVHVAARGSLAGHPIDRLRLDGTLGKAGAAPSALQLQVTSHGVHAGIAAEVRTGDTLQVRMSPLRLQSTADGLDRLAVPAQPAATLRYARLSGRLALTDFQIRGDAGDADVGADYAPQAGGSVTARLAWPHFPGLLADRLAAATAESLRAHWHARAPYGVGFTAAAGPHLTPVAATGSFSLPGPRAFAGVLPAFHLDDLGAVTGTFQLETTAAAGGRRFDLRLEEIGTPWIDTLRVHVGGSRQLLEVHEARLDMESAGIEVSGKVGARTVDLRAHYEVRDAAILRRYRRLPADNARAPIQQLTLRGDVRVHGGRPHLLWSGTVQGRVEAWDLRAPEIVSRIERDTTGVRGDLTLPRGLTSPWLALDHVQARWVSRAASDWLPARLGLEAKGQGLALRQSASLVKTTPWHVGVDTLHLRLGDKSLVAAQPFQISIDEQRLQVDALTLDGSLGTVAATGVASRDSTRFTARVALDLPEPPRCLVVRRDLWPRRLRAELDAGTVDSLRAALTIQGLRLAGGAQPELRADLHTGAAGLAAAVSVADTATILSADAALPVRLALWPPRVLVPDGAVRADVRFARLPVGIHTTRTKGAYGAEDLGRLQGRIVLGGTATALAAYADVQLRFPDTPNLSTFAFALRAHAGRDARVDSLWLRPSPAGGAPPAPSRAADGSPPPSPAPLPSTPVDLVVEFGLLSEATLLVRGDATVPVRFSLARSFVHADSTRACALRLRAEEVPLAASNPLLPHGSALEGKSTILLAADGPLRNPRLDGSVATSEVKLVLGNGSSVVFVTRAALGGDRRHPELRGDVEVKKALVKVPEAQRDLHPTAGGFLLQPAPPADTLAVAADSPAAHPTAADSLPADSSSAGGAARMATTLARTDVDIRLHVPGALSVRGRGLDIEGRGELQIAQKDGRPTVAGALHGVRGSYSIAGRTLTLDRGTVTFAGDVEVNPALDVQLSTTIGGTKIRVLVSGTAAAPVLTLSSDPEMEQTDIIALLAIGKTYDQLSDAESGIMRERATAILVSFGAAELQEKVTQDLGIDVVQYRSNTGAPGAKSADDSRAGSLAFGKYLSPKVLLSYSYSLDRAVEDIVSLEYFLKGQLTIETLYSVKGQSGLGFGWSMEY